MTKCEALVDIARALIRVNAWTPDKFIIEAAVIRATELVPAEDAIISDAIEELSSEVTYWGDNRDGRRIYA